MADRALYRLTYDGFRPFNAKAQDETARCRLGDVVELKLTKVRNGGFHRLFFAMLRLISENSNPHISEEQALYLAKVGAGCGQWIDTGRKELFAPGSISFASMDQVAFDAFVKVAIPPLVARFMAGTAPEAVICEAMELAA
jgi:hypothetical protein